MDAINHVLEWAFGTGGSSDPYQRTANGLAGHRGLCRNGADRAPGQEALHEPGDSLRRDPRAIMLGSLVSRAIAGSAPFVPTLVASAVLLALHWLFSAVAVRWHRFGDGHQGPLRASSSRMVGSTRRRCAPPI